MWKKSICNLLHHYDFYLNVSHVIGGNCGYPIQFLPFHGKKHLTWWWIGTIVHRSLPVKWRVNIKKLKSLEKKTILKKTICMKLLQAKLCSSSSWKTNLQIQPPPAAEYFDVRLVASEFHMAYLPSSLLSGSCAAVQLSNSSKTDRLPQPVLQIAAAVPSR